MPARPVRNPSLNGRYSMERSSLACKRMTWRLVRLHSPELSRTWLAMRALSFRGSCALILASASSRFRLFRFISRASCVSRSLKAEHKWTVGPSLPLHGKVQEWAAGSGPTWNIGQDSIFPSETPSLEATQEPPCQTVTNPVQQDPWPYQPLDY